MNKIWVTQHYGNVHFFHLGIHLPMVRSYISYSELPPLMKKVMSPVHRFKKKTWHTMIKLDNGME